MGRRKRNSPADEELSAAVHQALSQKGWLVPADEAAVAEAEGRLRAEPVPVPPELTGDPRGLLSSAPASVKPCKLRVWQPDSTETTLARAAREGGVLSAEIEEAMRRDREAAEAAFRKKRGGAAGHDQ